jgi:hypothetical protein
MTINGSILEHRMTRYARREEIGHVTRVGGESTAFAEVVWEVTCACGRVFQAPTEPEASRAYLDHCTPKKRKRKAKRD